MAVRSGRPFLFLFLLYCYDFFRFAARCNPGSGEDSYHARGGLGQAQTINCALGKSGLHGRANLCARTRFAWFGFNAHDAASPPRSPLGIVGEYPSPPQMRVVGAMPWQLKTPVFLGCHRGKDRSWGNKGRLGIVSW